MYKAGSKLKSQCGHQTKIIWTPVNSEEEYDQIQCLFIIKNNLNILELDGNFFNLIKNINWALHLTSDKITFQGTPTLSTITLKLRFLHARLRDTETLILKWDVSIKSLPLGLKKQNRKIVRAIGDGRHEGN